MVLESVRSSMRTLLFSMLGVVIGHAWAQDVTSFVNPFIGTAGGGNTFPGAVRPWGMVSVSPHTSPGSPSGYVHGGKYFYGFGHVHLSGTGCADLGSVIVTASRGEVKTDPNEYKCAYSDERASPGFYRVTLPEPSLQAEVAATARCGMTRFTALRDGEINILIDAGRSLNLLGGGAVTIRSDTEIEGYNISGGFCGEANQQRVYFVARFSEPAIARGIWIGGQLREEKTAVVQDSALGAWFRFAAKTGEMITVKVGISYVSIENARMNLEAEISGWDFERIKAEALAAWQEQLSRIRVEGGSRDDFVKFYTALYHTLIHPNLISDVNGEYPLMGRTGTGKYVGRDRYTVFSLWDTYRTLHPFLTLVYPERQSAIIQTMIDMYKESGWLPKWELAANETYMMVGDPAVPVIADSYVKGIIDFDIQTAYAAMRKPADTTTEKSAPPLRAGYHEYLRYHYIPFEQDTTEAWWVWGPVSTTLEYCFADWAIAQMAKKLGKTSEAEEFNRRSHYYKNLFDPKTQFMRPRLKNGDWLANFDPLQTEGSGSWSGSGGPGYVEGNAWNYTWFVPHDVAGLVEIFGGKAAFVQKLQDCFDNGQFTITNEPDIAYPYLFTYISGEEHRTQRLVRDIMNQQFSTAPAGLPGNDDAGTISGWFVFSALGFYPACPASEAYQLGIPLFREATIRLSNKYYSGKEFTIERHGLSTNGVQEAKMNGSKLQSYQINHRQIVAGGRLVFE
ncbi:MAG: hypothetical protein DKINENOH_04758 [bacterium]|nr:hypothetical protein [bacterium]